MGRRRKNVDFIEITAECEDSPKENKNMNKWEKIINNAFNQKMEFEEETGFEKINEKFHSDQEVKNILNELYIKNRNCDYFVKKQWHTLKKFNLQEKIHREESKIISSNEKQKGNEIYTEAIEKLAACHVIGFEPLNIIRKKLLNKIQTKYSIGEADIKEGSKRFENDQEDAELNKKRREDQLAALKKMIGDIKGFTYKEVDQATYCNAKNEIKKYEKELEMKATQNEIVEEKINTIEQMNNEIKYTDFNNNSNNNMNTTPIDNDMTLDEEGTKIKISEAGIDNLNAYSYSKVRNGIIDKIKADGSNNKENVKEFKSEIGNDLFYKFKSYGKFSDFDIHILLYVSHSITNELISAKNNHRDYNLSISPVELLKFLSLCKVDLDKLEPENGTEGQKKQNQGMANNQDGEMELDDNVDYNHTNNNNVLMN